MVRANSWELVNSVAALDNTEQKHISSFSEDIKNVAYHLNGRSIQYLTICIYSINPRFPNPRNYGLANIIRVYSAYLKDLVCFEWCSAEDQTMVEA